MRTSYITPGRAEKIVILTHFQHSARSEGAASSEKHLFVYVAIRCGKCVAVDQGGNLLGAPDKLRRGAKVRHEGLPLAR